MSIVQLAWRLNSVIVEILHVEAIISPVLLVFVFSGAFSQPGFHCFPADKVDEHVGNLWESAG